MPAVVYRRGPSSHGSGGDSEGGGPGEAGKILVSLLIVGVIVYLVSQGVLSGAPDRRAASSQSEYRPFRRLSSSQGMDAPQQHSAPPPGHSIKGNISVTTGARVYHVPGMRDYASTVIDTSRGERWFRTEAEAVASGWRRAGR